MKMLKYALSGMLFSAVAALGQQAMACNYSYVQFNSVTDIGGGQYRHNVTWCVGGGRNATAYGADQSTGTWGIALHGSASFASYPATLTSPMTSAVYTAGLWDSEHLFYDGSNWWTHISSGTVGSYCITFEFVTNGMPAAVSFGGAETGGVPWNSGYGCNEAVDMVYYPGGACTAPTVTGTKLDIASCSNGSVDISVSGGSSPYTYFWSTGETTQDISGLTYSNSYAVTVEGSDGCPAFKHWLVNTIPAVTANAGADQTIYIGYGASCVNLTASGAQGTAPYSYNWSTGGTTATINVCPTVTTTYTVTVTDARGCTATDNVVVTVKDIRCGTNKVYMCHSGTTKCYSTSQVPTHLAHGDPLGACGSKLSGSEMLGENVVTVAPNPVSGSADITFGVTSSTGIRLDVYNVNGAIVEPLYNGMADEQVMNFHTLNTENYTPGVYYIRLITDKGEQTTAKMVVVK